MKTTFLTLLLSLSFLTNGEAQAKTLFGTIDKYIIHSSNRVIEIASNEIEDDGLTASYYDYGLGKRLTIQMSEVSKSTRDSINEVQAGEMVLVTTGIAKNNTETISRYCQVYHLFENKKAYLGCKTYEIDSINGYSRPQRLDFVINNVESVTAAEVLKSQGFSKGQQVKLRIDTENAKSGRTMRILALFNNGEALVQKMGFSVLDTSQIIYKGEIDRVNISDLEEITF